MLATLTAMLKANRLRAADITFAAELGTPVVLRPLDACKGAKLTLVRINGRPIKSGGPAVSVANGSVTLSGNELIFTLAPGYTDSPTFRYTVSDGQQVRTAYAVGGIVVT